MHWNSVIVVDSIKNVLTMCEGEEWNGEGKDPNDLGKIINGLSLRSRKYPLTQTVHFFFFFFLTSHEMQSQGGEEEEEARLTSLH